MESDPVIADAAKAVIALLDYPGVTVAIDAGTEESRELMAAVKRIRQG